MPQAVDDSIEDPTVTQEVDGHQHANQVRDDTYSGLEAAFRPLYKGIKQIDLLIQSPGDDQQEDEEEDQNVEDNNDWPKIVI